MERLRERAHLTFGRLLMLGGRAADLLGRCRLSSC
jgi:hypothetical protein